MPVETASDIPFGKLASNVDKFMDQMQKGFFGFTRSQSWMPNVNLYENDSLYVVCVDLAGVDKDKIDLQLHGAQLHLSGRRVVPKYDPYEAGETVHGIASASPAPEAPPAEKADRWRIHLMEIDHGPFTRTVDLPEDVDRHNIRANYRNGMLWIEIPRG